jgi:hypothetical protein
MFRLKALSEVSPAGGLYRAFWHPKVLVQIAGCGRGDVTDGGVGDCKIIPRM